MAWQFAYIHGVARISLLSGKIQSAAIVFTLTHKTTTTTTTKKNPNLQKTVFTSCTQDSQWVRKRAKNFLEGVVQQKSDSFLGQEYVEPSPVTKQTHTPYQNHMQHYFV